MYVYVCDCDLYTIVFVVVSMCDCKLNVFVIVFMYDCMCVCAVVSEHVMCVYVICIQLCM